MSSKKVYRRYYDVFELPVPNDRLGTVLRDGPSLKTGSAHVLLDGSRQNILFIKHKGHRFLLFNIIKLYWLYMYNVHCFYKV